MPIANQPVSIPRFPSPRPSHRKPRSKDLRYDGKSSWKSFLRKFVRLRAVNSGMKWSNMTSCALHWRAWPVIITLCCWRLTPVLAWRPSLRNSRSAWIFSARPDPPVDFQSAVQGSVKSARQWSDRLLTLATLAFPQLPDVHAQANPRLCYRAENKNAGMYALDGQNN